jgi:HSP20 family protein
MAIRDIVPWRWGGLRRLGDDRPFQAFGTEIESLHRDIDRLFEGIWSGGVEPSLLSAGWATRDVVPNLDFVEDDNRFRLTVELPGMTDKDVDVSLTDRTLTISGEKKDDKEKKDKGVYRRERAYGSFRRVMELPGDVDADKIHASFQDGVLTIDLPKSKEAQEKVRRIPVKAA